MTGTLVVLALLAVSFVRVEGARSVPPSFPLPVEVLSVVVVTLLLVFLRRFSFQI